MKKTIAALLALVMALSLTACSKNETKKLVGTWQYAMDLTQVMNEEMAESYELEELDSAATFCVYMDFTVAEDGSYTLGVDMDATGESLTGYYQALTPVLAELVYAAGEAQGMSREEYEKALEAMGMTVEEYISTIFSAVDTLRRSVATGCWRKISVRQRCSISCSAESISLSWAMTLRASSVSWLRRAVMALSTAAPAA